MVSDVVIARCTNDAVNLASKNYGPCPRTIRQWVREFKRTGLIAPEIHIQQERRVHRGSVSREDLLLLKEILIHDYSLYGDEMSVALENETGRHYSARALCNAFDREGWQKSTIVYHANERICAERFAFRKLINSTFAGVIEITFFVEQPFTYVFDMIDGSNIYPRRSLIFVDESHKKKGDSRR